MTVNTELFQKIYDQITQEPETHDQGGFESGVHSRCGTTRCIAGWAVAFHYAVVDSIYEAIDMTSPDRELDGGRWLSGTAKQAADILGLSGDQGYDLFYDMSNESAAEKCLRFATKGDEA